MTVPFPDLVGVALAGGASRRMGRDKAVLRLDGRTLIASAVERLGAVCGEVVVADRGRGFVPPGATAVADGAGAGPAAGILGAASARPGHDLLVLACDLPRVPPALLLALAARAGDWVVPSWERGLEPLCALYRQAALGALALQVAGGRHAPRRLADAAISVQRLGVDDLVPFVPPRELFANLNTPEDLTAASLREAPPPG